MLKLLERLKNQNAPLDGLGLQGAPRSDARETFRSPRSPRSCTRSRISGLSILVTELDVKEAEYVASAEQRDQMAADEVRRYLDVVLQQPRVLGVTTWGLSDRHSWLKVTLEDYARFPGAWTNGSGPGLNRGLPLDFVDAAQADVLRDPGRPLVGPARRQKR